MAGRVQDSRRPAQFVGAEAREELLDRGAPFRPAQVAARRLTAVVAYGQDMVASSNRVFSRASRSFLISIRKRIFGK